MEQLLAILELRKISRHRIRLIHLPGESKNGLWVPDPQGVSTTVDLLAISPEDSLLVPSIEPTTIEVWNASGKRHLAFQVMKKLRNAGFDVVRWGNYNSRQKRTLVRDLSGNDTEAKSVAFVLDMSQVEIYTQVQSGRWVDIEVILGENYTFPEDLK